MPIHGRGRCRGATKPIAWIRAVILFAVFLCSGTVETSAASASKGAIWRPLRIGAGGWITGIDISPDGSTRVIRTDTYGGYVWDVSLSEWRQLVTASSMPAADVGVGKSSGVYELRVAPSAPARFYMAYRGYVYRSDDRGSHWSRTAFANAPMNANDDFRTTGPKMAVDPADPDVVYVGAPENGVFATGDGGVTWRLIDGIPKSAPAKNGQYPGHTGIAFDASSGQLGGRTKAIYASSYGNGVYRSVDAGASWARLPGGPAIVGHAKVAVDGAYYATGDDGHSLWRYLSNEWTNITPEASTWDTVVTDPFDPARIVAVRQGGILDISHDRGVTWGGLIWGPGYNLRIANDIPWLAWTNEKFMSCGDMMFDPKVGDQLWFAEGIGVWNADVPDARATPKSIKFTSRSRGIEQLVASQIISPPGGKPVVAVLDRAVFYIADRDSFPLTHGPDNQHAIVMGWALDYASTDPALIVGLMNWWGVEKSGYSTDGGKTWTTFASHPPVTESKIGGSIAASTPENIVWAPSNNSVPYYTTDGGKTWTPATIPGTPTTGNTGWGFAYYLNRHIVAADRVAAGTFYIYNSLKGLFKSTDGGANWAQVYPRAIGAWSEFGAQLESVPGQPGHLFFTAGPQGNAGAPHPASDPLMRSTDGGATWTAVPGVLEVRAFGFGRPLNGYPTIFIAGWVNRVYGIWQSADNARSWVKLGEFPLGSFDDVKTVEGDSNVPGLVYLGFAGSGFAYGMLGGSAAEINSH